MRASRMASVLIDSLSSQDWRLTYQHATRMRRALAQPSQQPTMADLRIEARLQDSASKGLCPGPGVHAPSQASASHLILFFFCARHF